jgi:hypothetical protein
MAYWMVACSVYLYIVTFGVNVRICRDSRAFVVREHAFAVGWPRAADNWRRAESWSSRA